MRSNAEIIGRDRIDDVDAILSVMSPAGEEMHPVPSGGSTLFTWDYGQDLEPLVRLYEKAKSSQWNATTDLDWTIDVDQEKVAESNMAINPQNQYFQQVAAEDRSFPLHGWTRDQFKQVAIESQSYVLSQFMHGEQGALLCTAKIVEQVPWIDAKYYGATQVMDEARHVEVFARYLNEKLDGEYPINGHLLLLLDDILRDERWDMTYLGMQIMVEGLALAAFSAIQMLTTEPLLKKLLRYVMSDEARHVAFGVLSLKEAYAEMSAVELRERQEFAFEAGLRMRDRLFNQDLWIKLGVDPKALLTWLNENTSNRQAQGLLFSKIVPNLKKLGLLDAADGWLRHKYEEMGVIQFEDLADTGAEYELLDEVAKDRAAT
ncbi:MAG: ferritin-like domain-containing protein [Actinobacteria bacterium ATB1]|nr:ferritin-like domain-containing protein [Actinobacteria bacterium ATB1]